ncbi:recombinase family protein [Scatolibacter rhodanostii]|uniref:recombinase family protein n=1 Tax=Scatolibacter rhodanostii TaxID=2014781 RepID=UPI000C078C74|nr:recombinase family protein [Scatolibacter rhodanostii]
MKPNITVIPATIDIYQQPGSALIRKRRVAAYARVSTDSEEQLTSYEAQVDYYTKYISEHPDWDFKGIYTDEGISAVNTKKREGFKQMVADGLAGEFDLLVTKSVSRFARNTVDSLNTIRQLKEKGVECFFEKENIWTFDGKGELLITIMSSLAQEESRNISQNVTWGQRKRFADGKVTIPYKQFLGYQKGGDGRPEIVESEAKIVRRIYQEYLSGITVREIARNLTSDRIPTPAGKEKWAVSTIMSILQNEKYRGDARLQKTFCTDFLTKKMVKNEGQVPQYYVENSHPAIVSPEIFKMVQVEIDKNRKHNTKRSSSCFADKVFCGECGALYGSKTWNSTSKYKRTVWQCNDKYKERGVEPCATPHVDEIALQQVFVQAINQILGDREPYISALQPLIDMLADTKEFDNEIQIFNERLSGIYAQLELMVYDNARQLQDQQEYMEHYSELSSRYEEVKNQLSECEDKKQLRLVRRDKVLQFMDTLRTREKLLIEFDEVLFRATVEKITVFSLNDVRVMFRDGREIQAEVPRKRYAD